MVLSDELSGSVPLLARAERQGRDLNNTQGLHKQSVRQNSKEAGRNREEMSDTQNWQPDPNDDIVDRILKRKDKSYLNFILIAANIIMFFVVEANGGSSDPDNMLRWGAAYAPLIQQGEDYRLFTSMFLHFGFEHLFSNMLLLFFIGDYMERYLGKLMYLLLYTAGGIYAGWFSFRHELAAGEEAVSAGASGAIFAVVGGLLILVIVHRGRLEDLTLKRMLLMAAFSLWVGFRQEGVDGYAHLGGFLAGVVITLLFVPMIRMRDRSTE